MPRYLLPPSVYVCVAPDGAIFLDLRSDAYIGLDRKQRHALNDLVGGWPTFDSPNDRVEEADTSAKSALAAQLAKRGLLTTNCRIGREVRCACVSTPTARLERSNHAVALGANDILPIVAAFVRSGLALHLGRLDALIAATANRKRRNAQPSTETQLRDLLHVFVRARPWVYTHRHKCLLDSLVLTDFLARRRVFATLVLGVQANPFRAHAWVQYEHYVLNDTPEYVSQFRPIVAI